MNSRLPNQITVEHGISEERVAIWEIDEKKHAGPLPGAQLLVFSPRGVTPTSEFVCVLPYPRW